MKKKISCNNVLKYLAFCVIFSISISANSQGTWQPITGKQRFTGNLGIPTKDTVNTGSLADSSQICLRPQDSLIYFKYKGHWRAIGSGSSSQGLQSVLDYNNALTRDDSTKHNGFDFTEDSLGNRYFNLYRLGSIIARISGKDLFTAQGNLSAGEGMIAGNRPYTGNPQWFSTTGDNNKSDLYVNHPDGSTAYWLDTDSSLYGGAEYIATRPWVRGLVSGIGGNTIYTGNGRFLNDRTVSAANHFLTFDSVNAFKVNIVNGLAFQGIDYQGDGTLAFYSNDGTNQYNPLLLTSDGVLNLNSNNLSGAEYAIFDIGSSGMHMASVDASNTASLVRMTLNGGVDTATLALKSSYFKVNNTHIKSFNAQSQNGDNANSFIAENNDGIAPSYTMSNLSAAANFKYSSLISYGSILGMYYLDDAYNRGTAVWESNAFLKSGTPNSYLTTLAALDNTGGSDKNASLLVHGGNGIGIQTASSLSQYGITYLRNDSLPNATSQPLQLPNATGKMLLAGVKVNGTTYYGIANGVADLGTISGGGGTVTSVATGNGLTGGTITATGTLKIDSLVTATWGRLYKVNDSMKVVNAATYVPLTTTVAGFALSSNVTLASLTATDATLTFSGAYSGGTARTVGINLGNANTWTATQTFGQPLVVNTNSTTLFSLTSSGTSGTTTTLVNFDGNTVKMNKALIVEGITVSGGGSTSLLAPSGMTINAGTGINISSGLISTTTGGIGDSSFFVTKGTTQVITGIKVINTSLNFAPQSSLLVPSNGFTIADSVGLVYVRADGFRRTLSWAGISANSKYNFPASVTADTLVTDTAPQTFTNKSINGSTNAITNISLTTGVTGTLPVASGGTNIASYAVGDILYASGSTALSKLADVAAGSILVSGGATTAPAYSTTPKISGSLVVGGSSLISTEVFSVQGNTNGAVQQMIKNSNIGSGAYAQLAVSGDASSFSIIQTSSTFTPSGQYLADGAAHNAAGAGGLVFATTNSTAVLRIFTAGGGLAERWRYDANGNYTNTGGAGTAYFHLKAGTATANTAPIKFTSGTLNSTIVAGQVEYNNGFYQTNNALNRYSNGGKIYGTSTDVSNTSTTETDLVTYTTKASTLGATDESLVVDIAGTLNDATSTAQLQFYFAGNLIGNTGALTVSATGGWSARIIVARSGSTTAKAMVTVTTPGASTAAYTSVTSLTGITFTNTNIIKCTGTSGGATGGTGDITAGAAQILWWGASNN